mgnify:CR=1 FL=1
MEVASGGVCNSVAASLSVGGVLGDAVRDRPPGLVARVVPGAVRRVLDPVVAGVAPELLSANGVRAEKPETNGPIPSRDGPRARGCRVGLVGTAYGSDRDDAKENQATGRDLREKPLNEHRVTASSYVWV